MVEVVTTDEFNEWYQGLEEDFAEVVTQAIDVLAAVGVALRYPRSSEIKGSKHAL